LQGIGILKKDRKIIGVALIIFFLEGKKGEFAIVLADKWQKKGIGIKLLRHVLVCAKHYGLKQVQGSVIKSNVPMTKMGEKLGFILEKASDSADYKLIINLNTL
jgi:acetyltransferase